MDTDRLLRSLIRGAMGGKKHKRSLGFLTGGRSSFLNASTLLGAVGVGWGIYETLKPKTTVPGSIPYAGAPGAGQTVPPPLPREPQSQPVPVAGVPPEVLRLVRLTISAARADGELSDEERQQILEYARECSAEALVENELNAPKSLPEIVSGALSPEVKRDMYVLAFGIVHADEGVSGAEQIYLAQLAYQLGLDQETTARLERETLARMTEPGA
ncbi:MAG: DUF533 domain-containing protein [Acidobacteria bacterium]|nr:MAG: DUF533 domain-containing protein [Acidobacteriota bacterium]